jgi:hypothetical protein
MKSKLFHASAILPFSTRTIVMPDERGKSQEFAPRDEAIFDIDC